MINEDQFKSFLSSNNRLKIDDTHITFKRSKFKYLIRCNDLTWKKKQETIINFELSIDKDDNVENLEALDCLIRRLSSQSGERIIINTIWDDISTYYAKKLYPHTVLIENLLRKIIYKFMIKIAGSSWFENTIPGSTRKAIKDTANKNDDKEFVSDQLYYADFIQLSSFLFDPYSSKTIDSNLINELKRLIDEETINQNAVRSIIEAYEPKSNWNRYFADKIQVEDLEDKWRKLYQYRNAVAHAKRLRTKDYTEAIGIINELEKAFKDCLDQIDSVHVSEAESVVVQKVARTTVPWEIDHFNSVQKLASLCYPSGVESVLQQMKPALDELNSHRPAWSVLEDNMSAIDFNSSPFNYFKGLEPSSLKLASTIVDVPSVSWRTKNSLDSKELSLSKKEPEKILKLDNNSREKK